MAFANNAFISGWLLCIAEKQWWQTSGTDLKGNGVISPRPEAVAVQLPEFVQHLSELLTGLLTEKRQKQTNWIM